MQVFDSIVEGVRFITPNIFYDYRGSFVELWNNKTLKEKGITERFVQDNILTSSKGVLRGVHTQLRFPQAKIVSCLKGSIFDVVVDCRPDSPTFGQWHCEILNPNNHKILFIPKGVAHGFYTLDDAIVYMKVTTHYTPGDEIGFMWNDEKVGIKWPVMNNVILADKDKKWGNFEDMMKVIKDYR